jgi:hypothetical protein
MVQAPEAHTPTIALHTALVALAAICTRIRYNALNRLFLD